MTEFHFHKVFKAHIQFATWNLVSNNFYLQNKKKNKLISFLPHREYVGFIFIMGTLKMYNEKCEYDAMLE